MNVGGLRKGIGNWKLEIENYKKQKIFSVKIIRIYLFNLCHQRYNLILQNYIFCYHNYEIVINKIEFILPLFSLKLNIINTDAVWVYK